MTPETKFALEQLKNALQRLEEVAQKAVSNDHTEIDATISLSMKKCGSTYLMIAI